MDKACVTTNIENKAQLKQALEDFWQLDSQIKEAKSRANEVRKGMLEPIKPLEAQLKALDPVISQYMEAASLPIVKSHGKIFQLKMNKSKKKLTAEELEELFIEHGFENPQSIIELTKTKKENMKQQLSYSIPVEELDEDLQDN